MAVTRAIDGLVRRAFPHTVAAAWHRASLTTSDANRIKHLLATQEVLLRTLNALILPDYLRGEPCDAVEQLLPALARPALGHWVGLLRETLRHLRSRELEVFCPEACDWYFTPKGKPSQAARLLDGLVTLRNEEAHGRALGPKETGARAAQLLSDMKALLGGLAWMTAYRPFRVLSQKTRRRGGQAGRVQFLVGVETQSEPEAGSWSAGLFQDAVFVSNPAGDAVLEISPLMQVLYDAGPRGDRVFLAASTRKSKKLVLKNDATGSEEAVLVEIEDAELSWEEWLEGRAENIVLLQNAGPAGVFAYPDWRPAGEAGHDLGERFEVKEVLGKGGMATVFRVWDTWDESEFALKVLHPELTEDRSFRERFRREAQMMRRLRHDHILRIVESGSLEDGRVYLKLPLLTGGTLQERIVPGGVPDELLDLWATTMLEGLSHAHREGVVHRDIKPENWLLDDEAQLYLADFGIALREDDARITRSMEQLGSLAYMSPEQRVGRDLDAKSDVYSLGVVFHELITGELGCARPGVGIEGPWGNLVRDMTDDDPAERPTAAECLARVAPGRSSAEVAPPLLQESAPPSPEARFHHHGPQGQAERALDEVLAAIRAAPDAEHLLWRPGWSKWKPWREVAEIVQIIVPVVASPPALPPPADAPRVEAIELLPGSFTMGDEGQRTVQLSRAFQLAVAPIDASVFDESGGVFSLGVSWFDALRFCNRLSERCGLEPVYLFGEYTLRQDWSMDDMGRLLFDLVGFDLINPVMSAFGQDVLDVLQNRPEELKQVKGVGPRTIERIAHDWNPDEWFAADVRWTPGATGWRLPTEAEWDYAASTRADELDGSERKEWVWDRAGRTWTNAPPALSPGDAEDPSGSEEGDKRVLRGLGARRLRVCHLPWERLSDGSLRPARWL